MSMSNAEQIQRIMAEEDGVDMSLEDIRKILAAVEKHPPLPAPKAPSRVVDPFDAELDAALNAQDEKEDRTALDAAALYEEQIYEEHKDVIDAEVRERMQYDDEIITREAEIRDEVIDEWYRVDDLVDGEDYPGPLFDD
jgi:DNA-binding transcriptional MerR regulator